MQWSVKKSLEKLKSIVIWASVISVTRSMGYVWLAKFKLPSICDENYAKSTYQTDGKVACSSSSSELIYSTKTTGTHLNMLLRLVCFICAQSGESKLSRKRLTLITKTTTLLLPRKHLSCPIAPQALRCENQRKGFCPYQGFNRCFDMQSAGQSPVNRKMPN